MSSPPFLKLYSIFFVGLVAGLYFLSFPVQENSVLTHQNPKPEDHGANEPKHSHRVSPTTQLLPTSSHRNGPPVSDLQSKRAINGGGPPEVSLRHDDPCEKLENYLSCTE